MRKPSSSQYMDSASTRQCDPNRKRLTWSHLREEVRNSMLGWLYESTKGFGYCHNRPWQKRDSLTVR